MSITTDKSAMNNKPRARYGSGSIRYNTAKNAYVVSYRGKCTTVRTRKLAEEKLREFRAIMKNVSDNERKKAKERKANGNMTLAEMVELYLTNEYDCNDHKIRTSIRQYQTFALFKEQPIANVKLKDFVAIDIKNKLFLPMQTEKSYITTKKVYELLRAAVRWASTPPQNLLAYDICAGKTVPAREKFTKDVEKIDKGIVKFYTAKQQQLIIQECDSRLKNGNLAFHYGPAIKLILHTGLRSGEALYLRWDDVDFINRTIFVNGTITEYTERTGMWAWKQPADENGNVTYTELTGDVRFKDVTFGYDEDKIILHDISLFAKPGQKLAFVGSTGAGKTTITNLINRFYDIQSGEIRYDDIDITKIKKDDLRRSLGIVLQDTHLFTGTIKDNIRYGKLNATDEEIYNAAKLAHADQFIQMLPNGYDTLLSGDGEELSQGQRQLLSIARAAVADPPVLILDEATSSIDTRTESIVQKGMDNLMKGRTVFVIAHRLSTIRNSNAIIVLDHGRIIERGDHEDLIAQKGTYYQLYTGKLELS